MLFFKCFWTIFSLGTPVLLKLFDIRFSYKHCNFSRVCLFASSETQGQSVGLGEKAGRKFSSTGKRATGYRLGTELFPKIQADAASWLGTKNALYYCAQSANRERLGCYQQEQFYLPREYSVFDGSQCIVNNRKFNMRRRRESQISNSFTRQNNNFARASRFFVHFLAVNCTTTRENA